jgi:hypothetical protein
MNGKICRGWERNTGFYGARAGDVRGVEGRIERAPGWAAFLNSEFKNPVSTGYVPYVVLGSCCLAALPFMVGWLLGINGTPTNVHGFAMLGWIVYAPGSVLCAIGLLIATAIRTVMRSKNDHAV